MPIYTYGPEFGWTQTNISNSYSLNIRQDELLRRYIEVIVILVVSILIIITNVINIYVISSTHYLPRNTKICVLNLSSSDLLVGLVSCLPCMVSTFMGTWPYGEVWCQVAGTIHGVSVTISIWSLSLISIDRYLATLKPLLFKKILDKGKIKVCLVLMWCAALLTFTSPILFARDFQYYKYNTETNMCGLQWNNKWFCIITALYIPIVSGIILIYTDTRIIYAIRAQKHGGIAKIGFKNQTKKETKAVRMLVATSLVYILFWMPYVVEVLVIASRVAIIPSTVKFITIWLANSNSFMNVFIYSVVYKGFRHRVKQLVCKIFCSDTGNRNHDV